MFNNKQLEDIYNKTLKQLHKSENLNDYEELFKKNFLCAKFYAKYFDGMKVYKQFEQIHIVMHGDHFYFVPKLGNNSKIELMHKNKIRLNTRDIFHLQFRAHISVREIIIYVYEHATAKYTNRFCEFTVKPK